MGPPWTHASVNNKNKLENNVLPGGRFHSGRGGAPLGSPGGPPG